jgi:hypothetical protein
MPLGMQIFHSKIVPLASFSLSGPDENKCLFQQSRPGSENLGHRGFFKVGGQLVLVIKSMFLHDWGFLIVEGR